MIFNHTKPVEYSIPIDNPKVTVWMTLILILLKILYGKNYNIQRKEHTENKNVSIHL
jgi:hypothetical protein